MRVLHVTAAWMDGHRETCCAKDRVDSLTFVQDIRKRRKLRAKSSEHDIEERNENVPLSNANALLSQKARQGEQKQKRARMSLSEFPSHL
jgi:hypothetical protein